MTLLTRVAEEFASKVNMQPRTGRPHAMLVLLDEPPPLRCGTLNSSENCSSKFYKEQWRLSVCLCQGATEEELCQCDGHLFQGTCVQCETGTRHSVKIANKLFWRRVESLGDV